MHKGLSKERYSRPCEIARCSFEHWRGLRRGLLLLAVQVLCLCVSGGSLSK